ncbi:PAS domain-containing protein [Streptomyces peucetius]|uniref:PAS domain-containing protein n=1 Tax=Streptomyces peucetius TaxID=1950 RepID=A0ABY6I030_STRPE|nr:PAS domain-containing protein [Streptomyces peucetius]UYQ60331.1 PAS domain-containing protein [Streptomyces peucetius]
MAEIDEFGDDLEDFVRRVGELRAARGLPPEEQQTLLDATLFELQHVAETLWPKYERLAGHGPARAAADRTELQLLRALFQRLPLPVALMGGDTVVRRMNLAATDLTGVRAGFAAGRPLSGLLRPGDRAALRSQAAAVARGEGPRSLRVHLQQQPDETLRATLTALRPPNEPQPAVLMVLQSDTVSAAPAGADDTGGAGERSPGQGATGTRLRRVTAPDLAEVAGHAAQMDLLDAMTTALLRAPAGDPEAALAAAAAVLASHVADWVVADLVTGGGLRRTAVLGPDGDEAAAVLGAKISAQDPAGCPLVVESAGEGSPVLQVRPEDLDSFGRDRGGDSVLVQADVTSLMCVPLRAPVGDTDGEAGPVLGVLSMFRSGSAPAFSMAQARAVDVVSRHVALAMRRSS